MRLVSLFSGAGGSCLGWHAAGAEHSLCCEWDTSAGATLAAAGFPWSSVDLSDPEALETALEEVPGVVACGIFAHRRADIALVAGPDGVREIRFGH